MRFSQSEVVLLSNLQHFGERYKECTKEWLVNTDPVFVAISIKRVQKIHVDLMVLKLALDLKESTFPVSLKCLLSSLDWTGSMVEKGENCGHHHFLLTPFLFFKFQLHIGIF